MALVNELIDQVLRRLDELSTTAPVHWTRAEILVFVNEALSELNLIAWEFQDTAEITFNTNDNVYNNPTTILAPISVRAPNYLRRQTADDIDHEVKWDSPSEKRLHSRTWAPLGLNKIMIYPRPLGSLTGYVEGIIEHVPVTDSAMDLPTRPEYDGALEDYCVERATFKEGPSELEQASRHYKNFLDQVQECSGRNVIRMYPRYSSGVVGDDNLREQVEDGAKNGH
jgi:hypothetical protein